MDLFKSWLEWRVCTTTWRRCLLRLRLLLWMLRIISHDTVTAARYLSSKATSNLYIAHVQTPNVYPSIVYALYTITRPLQFSLVKLRLSLQLIVNLLNCSLNRCQVVSVGIPRCSISAPPRLCKVASVSNYIGPKLMNVARLSQTTPFLSNIIDF